MGQPHRRRLVAQLCEKCCWSRSVRKGSQRTQRILGSTGQAGYHLIGVNTNALQLGDELSNNFRVRHPAPDWGWRRRATGRATGSRLVGRVVVEQKQVTSHESPPLQGLRGGERLIVFVRATLGTATTCRTGYMRIDEQRGRAQPREGFGS